MERFNVNPRYAALNEDREGTLVRLEERLATVVARHERLRLSARDGARVLDLLEHPPKPTPALRAAAKRLRRIRA